MRKYSTFAEVSTFVDVYTLSLIYFNIIVYLLLLSTLFSVFFLFDLRLFRTLNEFKGLNNLVFCKTTVAITILSLAGMPPMLGFVGKFLMFSFFLAKNKLIIALFFAGINLFLIYFYIQNIRFLLTKSTSQLFLQKNNFAYINFNIVVVIFILNCLNIFGIFFIEDIFIFIDYVNSFIYLG